MSTANGQMSAGTGAASGGRADPAGQSSQWGRPVPRSSSRQTSPSKLKFERFSQSFCETRRRPAMEQICMKDSFFTYAHTHMYKSLRVILCLEQFLMLRSFILGKVIP
jgi:hypothetical protein